jgi:hypothetical protein
MTGLNKIWTNYRDWIILGGGMVIIVTIKWCFLQKREKAMVHSIVLVGEIVRFEPTRGATNVYVDFNYNGKILESYFSTYDTRDFTLKEKIRIRVSKEAPSDYIDYVGPADTLSEQ